MRTIAYKSILSVAAAAFLFACDSDDSNEVQPEFQVSDTYSSSTFAANTTELANLQSSFSSLVSTAKAGRTGEAVEVADLQADYTAGSPSVADNTSSWYNSQLTGEDGYFAELAAASGNTWAPGETDGEGGVYGGYLFDENGMEVEQLIDKGLYGALLYNQAQELLAQPANAAAPDQVLALFGANPAFPNSDNAANVATPDAFMAKYVARRDALDGNGIYTKLNYEFRRWQSAIAAGNTAEQQAATAAIAELWEKGSAATAINYLHSAISKLSATNPSEAEVGSALHAYAEAIGFIQGFYTLENKLISDAQIEQLSQQLLAPIDGEASSYLFATEAATELPRMVNAIAELQSIYNFSDAEIESFRTNWVNQQSR